MPGLEVIQPLKETIRQNEERPNPSTEKPRNRPTVRRGRPRSNKQPTVPRTQEPPNLPTLPEKKNRGDGRPRRRCTQNGVYEDWDNICILIIRIPKRFYILKK